MTAKAYWWPGRPGLSQFQENARRDPVILRAWLTQGSLSFAVGNQISQRFTCSPFKTDTRNRNRYILTVTLQAKLNAFKFGTTNCIMNDCFSDLIT